VTMGGARPAKPRNAPARQASAPALDRLADRLSDAFDTRVKVELGKRKGKIVVEFGSIEDLERIITTMSPEWAAALSA
jgi:ParB family transcriptional regulator, chromosome partitioning protein